MGQDVIERYNRSRERMKYVFRAMHGEKVVCPVCGKGSLVCHGEPPHCLIRCNNDDCKYYTWTC